MKTLRALETVQGITTKGKTYQESREYEGRQSCYYFISDDGSEDCLFKERFEVVGETLKVDKPPLGLRPEFIVLELRQREIKEAVLRYMEAGKEVPKEWAAEYYRNNSRLLGVL